mgnify:CR=1 FL=1
MQTYCILIAHYRELKRREQRQKEELCQCVGSTMVMEDGLLFTETDEKEFISLNGTQSVLNGLLECRWVRADDSRYPSSNMESDVERDAAARYAR